MDIETGVFKEELFPVDPDKLITLSLDARGEAIMIEDGSTIGKVFTYPGVDGRGRRRDLGSPGCFHTVRITLLDDATWLDGS